MYVTFQAEMATHTFNVERILQSIESPAMCGFKEYSAFGFPKEL